VPSQAGDRDELRLAVALGNPRPGDISALAELGIDELILVEAPPHRPEVVADWVSALADHWMIALP
jgi:hypothetical protein